MQLGMHICDGFALAGGPWITPEESMQKVVWSDTIVNGGNIRNLTLPMPEALDGYYEDIVIRNAIGASAAGYFTCEPKLRQEIEIGCYQQMNIKLRQGERSFPFLLSLLDIQYEYAEPSLAATWKLF